MPRTYVKKTSRGNFNEEQLDAAINAVKEGKSIREAGRMFGIAESTIRLRMKRRCLKLERRIKQEFEDYTYYYKPGEGEYYEVNGSQARVKEEIEDPEMDSSSHMYTFVPETHFEGSEQTASVYVPETSFETSDQSIKLVNHSKTKSKHSQEQKQLENSEQRISNAIDELREISKSVNSTKTEDEFDIFGRSVAAQLRQLPLMEALSIQLKLQMTLTEARIKASQNESE